MTTQPVPEKNNLAPRFDNAWLCQSVQAIAGRAINAVDCSPLTGDASDRKYYRISYPAGELSQPSKSMILMQLQAPLPGPENDFTRILKFLRAQDLPVPELYQYHTEKGLLFLEDLGGHTLEDWIREHPENKEAYYRQAVDLLVRLHHRATKNISADCPAFHLFFDIEKLMWEMDFMLEHYVKGLHQSHLNAEAVAEIRGHFLSLCQTLANQESIFTHRDFHCRNMMVHNGHLILLDFQDARMGPCQYDLVSLLKDSYLVLEDEFRNELIERYIQGKEKADNLSIDRQEFQRIFDLMSIQRNLKAVGTFAFQAVARGNRRYLEYIPQTLAYVQQTLKSQPDLKAMSETLVRYLPGLLQKV
jgi:aminoglycoside/choline kinase family phosphotransferase